METEQILTSELQVVSEEYGLSREQRSAAASLTDEEGTLYNDLGIETGPGNDVPPGFAADWVHDSEDGEVGAIRRFLEAGCGCKMGRDGRPCTSSVTFHEMFEYRANCHELTSNELDMVILGQLNAHCTLSASVPSSSRTSNAASTYFYKNNQQCRKCFLFMHTISDKRFRNLVDHYKASGVTPRVHGLAGKSPPNTTSLSRVTSMLRFIKNLASSVSLPLPGRLPNFRDERVQLLPTDMSKLEVYRKYRKAAEREGTQPVGRSTFLDLWNKQLPYIMVMKPATDLCWVCQQNLTQILRSTNRSEEDKSQCLERAQLHIDLAKKEREHYNSECRMCAEQWKQFQDGSNAVYTGAMHYSFDYAQQVHFPSNALQPGPLFFKTARKCQVFGICCEPKNEQVNYLIDEADYVGKGGNSTVSMLHHYLENHGVKEKDVRLQADNCVGQNKNNIVIQYLVWRAATRRSKCSLSFMLAGHTKFAPDRFFGLFKRRYRHCNVCTLDDVSRAVLSSTITGQNKVQLTAQHGRRLVHWYDWAHFFSSVFRHLPNITSYHHFRTDSAKPGFVFAKEYCDSTEIEFCMLKQHQSIDCLQENPSEIQPPGLDPARQWYLYENIRPFCGSVLAGDMTCPLPSIPKPGTSSDLPRVQTSNTSRKRATSPPTTSATLLKQARTRACSYCKETGHFKSRGKEITCPKLLAEQNKTQK